MRTKTLIYSLSFLFVFFVLPGAVYSAVFNVSNPVEFQNALTTAQSNGEDNTINVQADMIISSPLTYLPPDGNGGQSLTINGNGHILDGNNSVQIMNIDTENIENIGCVDRGWHITIRNLTFQNGNLSTPYSGILSIYTCRASILIEGCTFRGNSSDYAVDVSTSSGVIEFLNNVFIENSGDGLSASSMGDEFTTIMWFKNNIFIRNLGRAISAQLWEGNIMLANNVFIGNSSGVNTWKCCDRVYLVNNTFVGNGGLGVYMYFESGFSWAIMYNNIIWESSVFIDTRAAGPYITTVELYNNDIGPNSDFETGQSEDLYIVHTDNYYHGGNIKDDPLLVDPVNGDVHLTGVSPCIDSGDNDAPYLPATDFEGDDRIIDGDGDSTAVVDMGADEYASSFFIDIDANGSDGPVNLQRGDSLSVTITLTPGDMAGQDADWWVVARDPSFRYYFYDSDTGRWVLKCFSCVPVVSYQGGLIEMGPYEVLNTTAGPQMLGINTADLPTGTYTFYFGVDLNMDGKLDMDQMYYDSVEVNITP